jgi:outer membrane protein
MKRMNKFGLLLAVLLAPAAAMAQEARVVAVDTEQAVLKSEAGKIADKKLTTEIDKKKEEFKAKDKKLTDAKAEFELKISVWSAEKKAEMASELDRMDKEIKRGVEDTNVYLDKMRDEELGWIVRAAKAELDKLVQEKSYDIVIDLAGDGRAYFVYVNPKIDITEELVKRINANAVKTSAVKAEPTPGEAKPAAPKQ